MDYGLLGLILLFTLGQADNAVAKNPTEGPLS